MSWLMGWPRRPIACKSCEFDAALNRLLVARGRFEVHFLYLDCVGISLEAGFGSGELDDGFALDGVDFYVGS